MAGNIVRGAAALALASAAVNGAADAADWHVAGVADSGIVFIDLDAVTRDGDQVTFSTWIVRTGTREQPVDNWKARSEAHCISYSYRDLRVDYYAGTRFVEGASDEPRRDAEPDTMAFSKIAVACGNKAAGEEAFADPYRSARERGAEIGFPGAPVAELDRRDSDG